MEEEFRWVTYIRDKVLKKNKNFIGVFTGPTGSGKSWSALSAAELIDDNFHIDHVVFKAKDLMNLVNSGNLKKGSVIVWEEVGVELSNRNWFSVLNKMLNYLLQTFRHKNFVLLFTVPYGDFVDSATRKLFHAEFQVETINRQKKTCSVKPKLLQYNSHLKKWYEHYLKFRTGRGKVVKVKRWKIPQPSKELIKIYEQRKTFFTDRLNKEIKESIDNVDLNGKPRRELTENQQKIIDCWKKGLFIQQDISNILNITQEAISQSEGFMRRKGYLKEDYRKPMEIPVMA